WYAGCSGTMGAMVDDVLIAEAAAAPVPEPVTPAVTAARSAPPVPMSELSAPMLPWWLAVLAALAAGGAVLASVPLVGLWWLAPVGVALFALAAHRRGMWAGFGLGLLVAGAFFVPLLSWTGMHVGLAPWLILAIGEGVILALVGACTALISPLVDRWQWM